MIRALHKPIGSRTDDPGPYDAAESPRSVGSHERRSLTSRAALARGSPIGEICR